MAPDDDDTTAYLLRSPANRERLEAALAASRDGRRTLGTEIGEAELAARRRRRVALLGRDIRQGHLGVDDLARAIAVLPSDYAAYGGTVERWAEDGRAYPDCSCGCRWAAWLAGAFRTDYCVCTRPDGPRRGYLTFEHQAGMMADGVMPCYETEKDYRARRKAERAAGGPPDGA